MLLNLSSLFLNLQSGHDDNNGFLLGKLNEILSVKPSAECLAIRGHSLILIFTDSSPSSSKLVPLLNVHSAHFTIAYLMSNLVKSLRCRIALPRFDTWLWFFLAMSH